MRFLGLDRFLQRSATELIIADEVDAPNFRARALIDLEDQVDAILIELDDLGIDRRAEAAVPAIQLLNTLDVVLDPGPGVDHAGPQLQLALELVFLELAVTLEGDPVDDRVLGDLDHQGIALAAQHHVGKEPGLEQFLQRLIEAIAIEALTGLDLEIRANGRRLDTFRSFDSDGGDGATKRHRVRNHRPGRLRDRVRSDGQNPRGDQHRRHPSSELEPQRTPPPSQCQEITPS